LGFDSGPPPVLPEEVPNLGGGEVGEAGDGLDYGMPTATPAAEGFHFQAPTQVESRVSSTERARHIDPTWTTMLVPFRLKRDIQVPQEVRYSHLGPIGASGSLGYFVSSLPNFPLFSCKSGFGFRGFPTSVHLVAFFHAILLLLYYRQNLDFI
jgi:hypothetical protein